MGRAYALQIENYSGSELQRLFDKHISEKAKVVTDNWTGYKTVSKEYKIKQKYSDGGLNFPTIHNLIMNIKSWIRGIHHSVSIDHIQKYLDEFCFRLNLRNIMKKMPMLILNRIVQINHTKVKLCPRGNYG